MFEKIFLSERAVIRHRQIPLCKERESYLEARSNQGVSRKLLMREASLLYYAVLKLRLTDDDQSKIPVEKIIWCTQARSKTVSPKHPDSSVPRTDDRPFENLISEWFIMIGRMDERYEDTTSIFNILFRLKHARRIYIAAPFYNERKAHLEHLLKEGYSLSIIERYARYHLILIKYLKLSELRCISSDELEKAVIKWDETEGKNHRKQKYTIDAHNDFIHIGYSWFSFLGLYDKATELPPEYDVVQKYLEWIISSKGCSRYTEKLRTSHLMAFFRFLEKSKVRLAYITLSVLDNYITSLGKKNYSRATMAGIAASLKSFFLFAELQGLCRPGLKDSILIPKQYAEEGLPTFVSWDTVKKMISSQESSTATGKRNRAIMLLMAIYGLRCCEITNIKLRDIDWRREKIHIQRVKGGKLQTLPLIKEVGDAIICYIREARQNESGNEYLFLRALAPYNKMRAASLYHVVCKALKAQGLLLQKYGPHVLRHSCATYLMNSGHSIKEVADLLGHNRLDTTRIYAKVDIAQLIEVANMDWSLCL